MILPMGGEVHPAEQDCAPDRARTPKPRALGLAGGAGQQAHWGGEASRPRPAILCPTIMMNARHYVTRSTLSALGALALAAALPVQAQTKLQPGLWEHTMLMKTASGQMEGAMAKMQSQLASMPPEQRKMIEDRMAQSGAGMGAKPNIVRVCLSKERAERGDTPQGDGRCKQEVLQRSGGTMKFRFTCAGNPPSSGEGDTPSPARTPTAAIR